MKSGENWSGDFRKEDVGRLHDIIMYIAQGQGQITHREQKFDCN